LHGFEIARGCRLIGLFELAHPCLKQPINDAQSLGHIHNRMPFVDHLLDRPVLELDGVFRSLHLLFFISVF